MRVAVDMFETAPVERVSSRREFPQDAESRPVDLVHLSRFTMGNRELEQEVLLLFCKQSEIFIDRLKEAGDDKTWMEAAHTLKGSARGIGAWEVGDAAYDVEQLKGEQRISSGPEAVSKLEKKLKEACDFIASITTE